MFYKMEYPEKDKIVTLVSLSPSFGRKGLQSLLKQWQEADFSVELSGTDLDEMALSNVLKESNPDVLAISCTSPDSISTLKNFLQLEQHKLAIPLIIGGLYADPFLANTLSDLYRIKIYYSRGIEDCVKILSMALEGRDPDPPCMGEAKPFPVPVEFEETAEKCNISFLEGPVDLIELTSDPLMGCEDCPGKIDRTCPLASGYTKIRSITESRALISTFRKVILMITPALSMKTMEISRNRRKSLWYSMLEIESIMEQKYGRAMIFKFPVKCPICEPGKCIMPQGKCNFPELIRPLHEEYCINMPATIMNIAGDRESMEMYALVLTGENRQENKFHFRKGISL